MPAPSRHLLAPLLVFLAACSGATDPAGPDPAGSPEPTVLASTTGGLTWAQLPRPRTSIGNIGSGFVNEWSRKGTVQQGWNFPLLVDINNDGFADLCGTYGGRYGCVRNVPISSQLGSVRVFDSTFIDAPGFAGPEDVTVHATVTGFDHNGDGRLDLCGRAAVGVICHVSQGPATSPTFAAAVTVLGNFSNANFWNQEAHSSSIRFVQLLGRQTICGRGSDGLLCYSRNSANTAFTLLKSFTGNFTNGFGWNQPKAFETFDFVDLNGDGHTDACGRGNDGILCSTFMPVVSALPTRFLEATWRTNQFRDAHGWNAADFYRTVVFADLNNDGRADVCGRGNAGLYCGRSAVAGDTGRFIGDGTVLVPGMSDGAGWAPPFPSANRVPILADVDADGRRDLCTVGPKPPSATSLLPSIWCARNLSQPGGAIAFGTFAASTDQGTGLSGNRRVARGRIHGVASDGSAPDGFCWSASGNVFCTERIVF